MKKNLYVFGFCFTIFLSITLNNYFWYTIGRSGTWIDNGVTILFAFLFISIYITYSHYKHQYYERSTALKLALWFGTPTILLIIMSLVSEFEGLRFEHYFTMGMFLLTLNYALAAVAK